MRLIAVVGILSWALLGASSTLAQPSVEVIRDTAKGVVRIVARSCPGSASQRQGTGFLWPDRSSVVTALHVVAECGDVTVQSTEPQVTRRASLTKVLKKADLALLRISEDLPAQTRALKHGARAPAPQEELATVSMPLNTPSWQDTYGRRSVSVTRLDQLLDDSGRKRLREQGTPDVNLEIFRLDAIVKPGSSGGPVINSAGEVVGVIDGGLDGGSSALNWATPARFLTELRASSESLAVSLGARVEETFSYSIGQDVAAADVGTDFTCGNQPMFKLARRTLEEVLDSVDDPKHLDDPLAFMQIVANFSNYLSPQDLSAISFDLYVLSSGATVAIPAGFELSSEDAGFCLAEAPESDVGVLFRTVTLPSSDGAYVQSASMQFEAELATLLEVEDNCFPDQAWTQVVPKQRWDGLVSRRAGFNCVDPYTGELDSYLFGSHLARNNSYTGVVAGHEEMESFAYGDREVIKAWAAASIAAVISTYQL